MDRIRVLQNVFPLPRILDYITQAAGLGTVKVIVFSGGECFTLGPELVIAIAKATELGLATRCVTNGYWAISRRCGRAAGPAEAPPACKRSTSARAISISAFLAPTKVVTGAIAGVRAGMRVVIVVESRKSRRFTADQLISDPRIGEILASSLFRIVESPWMAMARREDLSSTIAPR